MSLKSMIFRWNPFAIECFYREWVFFILEKKEMTEKKKFQTANIFKTPNFSR